MKFDITVTCKGKWWMVAVPAIDWLTQARLALKDHELIRPHA